ncbi:MAG: hypothetical protein ABIC95_05175 [archaeon]
MKGGYTKRSKTASLNLSVEAIVILVMAITMLGLGLGFIKERIGSANTLMDEVSDNIKESVRNDLLKSGNKVSISVTELTLNGVDSDTILMAVRNEFDTATDFTVKLQCFSNTDGELKIWRDDETGLQCDMENLEFIFSDLYESVKPNDIQFIPLKVKSKEKKSGSFQFAIDITYTDDVGEKVYDSKQFFIKGI